MSAQSRNLAQVKAQCLKITQRVSFSNILIGQVTWYFKKKKLGADRVEIFRVSGRVGFLIDNHFGFRVMILVD